MAQEQNVSTSASPTVVIGEGNGELRLMGWDRPEVLARAEDELSLNRDGDTVSVRYSGEAVVRVPQGATLRIDSVSNDVRIKGMDGDVSIGNVSGDLTLRQTGAVRISSSSGDTSLKHVRGELHIDNVSGDLSVLGVQGPLAVGNVSGDMVARAVQGAVSVGQVSGDMSLQGVQGEVNVDRTSGDVRLAGVQGNARFGSVSGDASLAGVQGQLTADKISGDLNAEGLAGLTANVGGDATISLGGQGLGQTTVNADGAITCRVAPDATNIEFRLTSGSSDISINLPGTKNDLKQHDYVFKMGATGEIPVTLSAAGDVSVNGWSGEPRGPGFDVNFDFNFEPEGFFPKDFLSGKEWSVWGAFGERVAERARRAAERANERAHERAEHANERAREHAERASAKAAEHADRAARKAEEQVRRAQEQARKAERRAQFMGRRYGPGFSFEGDWRSGRPPAPPEPPSEPVSDEERMTILRMLEEKKITVEQAEKLLSALSGNVR
jgi:hypothetical protein